MRTTNVKSIWTVQVTVPFLPTINRNDDNRKEVVNPLAGLEKTILARVTVTTSPERFVP